MNGMLFRFNEDSLRVYARDIEANVTTIPSKLTINSELLTVDSKQYSISVNNMNLVNTKRSQPSSPGTSPGWLQAPSHRNIFSHSLGTPVKTGPSAFPVLKRPKRCI